jgi:arginine/lysine/ornithine decarboxylase
MAVEKLESLVSPERGLEQQEAPIVEAIAKVLDDDVAPFTIPAHKQGRALDPGLRDAVGADTFRHDIGMLNETKLVIDVTALGLNGYDACGWLRKEQKVVVELADHRRVMAIVTLGDDEASIERLGRALRALAEEAPSNGGPPKLPPPSALQTELVQLPRDAYFAQAEHVPLDESVGRVVAEKVTPYPPGVPVLIPGERITQPIVDYLRVGVELGMNVTDVADSQLETVRVVR